MAFDNSAQRRSELYSHKRNEEANALKQILQQTNIMKDGEYNFNHEREKAGAWQTWTKTDFRGTRPITADKAKGNPTIHLQTNFILGKHNEDATYQTSRTKEDFVTLPTFKPAKHSEDRTVKWPDMAPQYVPDRKMASSVYSDTFLVANLQPSKPDFPKSKKQQTDDSGIGPSVCLGSDAPYFYTEAHNSYAPPQVGNTKDGYTAHDISSKMKTLARKSNVFRTGDYNNMKQEPGSMFTLDFCKKSYTPSTFQMTPKSASQRTVLQDVSSNEPVKHIPHMIDRCLKEQRQDVLKDASDGRQDHESAHFLFGNDNDQVKSVYAKDFLQNSVSAPSVSHLKFQPAPPGSQVMHFDPTHNNIGSVTSRDLNVQGAFSSLNGGNNFSNLQDIKKRHGTSVKFSFGADEHKNDRISSLSHQSYVQPPSDFKALRARTTPKPMYNYIAADGALTYKLNIDKESEARNQFRSISMDPISSSQRQLQHNELNLAQKNWVRSTHFTTGYHPPSFATAREELFSGTRADIPAHPAAGKTEIISDSDFKHFNISDNTQDLKPNPFRVDIMAPLNLQAQAAARNVPALPVHNASLMKNDFQSMENRKYTPAQLMVMRQNELLGQKPIEKSHFFHSDTSGGKNFQSTAMADYIKPELVTTPRNMTSVN